MNKILYIIVFVIVTATFSAILPYPIFSNHTNITEGNAYEINNFHEVEMSATSDESAKILPLEFDYVNFLLPMDEEFEIFDVEREESFVAKRTGGKNHVDFEPINAENAQILLTMIGENFSWTRRPVLVKLSENAFVPASMSEYPHGHSTIENGIFGHFCLHFLNSKTDGTQEIDAQHQKCVKYAQNHGGKIFS